MLRLQETVHRWKKQENLFCILKTTIALLAIGFFVSLGMSPNLFPTDRPKDVFQRYTPPPLLPQVQVELSRDEIEPPPPIKKSPHDYDLAHILNIRAFKSMRNHQTLNTTRIQEEATTRPGSIIAYYAAESTACTAWPSITRLRTAVATYFSQHHSEEAMHVNDATLHIYHDPTKLDIAFVQAAKALSKKFKRVRLLVPDPRLQKRVEHGEVLLQESNVTDTTVALMSVALHLLVHTGDTAALGALVTRGTMYHTEALAEYTSQNAFKWLLSNRVPLQPEKISPFAQKFQHMGPVRPTCCNLQPFGEGDEEKIFCTNAGGLTPPCWILAVGSAGRFGFERNVLSKCKCKIHTFDCTGDWKVPTDIADHVTLHKLCLGDKNEGLFRTWGELIKIGSDALGTGKLTMPAFTKMDIEGFEFPAIRSLVESSDAALPLQIAMEVHKQTNRRVGPPYVPMVANKSYYVKQEIFIDMFRNLSKIGYDLVHRADNPFCPHCSEVLVVKRSALPAE